MDNREQARILSTITNEQWKAIASLTQEQWEEVLNKSEGRISKYEESDKDEKAKLETMRIMKELGITANLNGYNYLLEAVIRVYRDPSYMQAVTKRLYPDIAKKFSTTSSSVERSIRYVINKTVDESEADVINMYFAKGNYESSAVIAELVSCIKLYQ